MNRTRLNLLIACVALALANTACTVEDAPPIESERTQTQTQTREARADRNDNERRVVESPQQRATNGRADQDDCLSPDGEPELGCHTLPPMEEPQPPSSDDDPKPPSPEDEPQPPSPEDEPLPPSPEDEPEPAPHPIPEPAAEECDGLDNDEDGEVDESLNCFEPEPPPPPAEERDDIITADCSEFEDVEEISTDGLCEAEGLLDGRETCYIWEEQPELEEGESGAIPPTIKAGCILVQYCSGRNSTNAIACEPAAGLNEETGASPQD